MNLKGIVFEVIEWNGMIQGRIERQDLGNTTENLQDP